MRFFKKVFGYSIGFIRDKDAPPIESSISEKKVYVNLSRCVSGIFTISFFVFFIFLTMGHFSELTPQSQLGKSLIEEIRL